MKGLIVVAVVVIGLLTGCERNPNNAGANPIFGGTERQGGDVAHKPAQ